MFSLESPHRGNSNEYTQYTIFNMEKKITLNYPRSATMFFFSKGFKIEFETAVVNEPSVFEPLKFYCMCHKEYEHEIKLSDGIKSIFAIYIFFFLTSVYIVLV